MPETTEGPYYIEPELVRADITEEKTGVPLKMQIQVVDANCTPIPDARVDIWHCDAQGNYSGYANQGSDGTVNTEGETFLRGTLMADESGIVSVDTIYPGWYRGAGHWRKPRCCQQRRRHGCAGWSAARRWPAGWRRAAGAGWSAGR
ncbi:hypothetical protein [Marivivens donghaensis]|uniref:dioxygenase family protein n=1 Tax=Marivivens donghaensis TaxID=1699413 RepID=UPI001FE5D455|nr:hypothetical protein [Marivivens donghaensis]